MGINTYIKDPGNGISANVEEREGKNRFHVLTEPAKYYIRKGLFFLNPEFGSNLNINASLTSSTLNIYDGGDNTYWTPMAISGTWDFQSTTYAHTGTYSVDATKTKNDDTAEFYNDTFVNILYSSLVGWIYITTWGSDDEVLIYGWNTNTDTLVGTRVNIGNYVNTDNTNTWLEFVIPIDDLDLYGRDINAVRVTTINTTGNAPNYYLDDIAFQGDDGGGPYRYSIEPKINTWLHVYGIGITLVNQFDSTITDSTLRNIPYDSLLGRNLANGILYQRQERGEIQFSYNFKKLIEIISQPNGHIVDSGFDGTYSWLKIELRFDESPLMLRCEYQDFLSITISEDFSPFEFFKVSADCKEEDKELTHEEKV